MAARQTTDHRCQATKDKKNALEGGGDRPGPGPTPRPDDLPHQDTAGERGPPLERGAGGGSLAFAAAGPTAG